MDIIGYIHTMKLGKIITFKKCMTVTLGEKKWKNPKKEEGIFIIRKLWETIFVIEKTLFINWKQAEVVLDNKNAFNV